MRICWTIKASFVAYVEAAEGIVSVSGEAVRHADRFEFPAEVAPSADGRCVSASGGVRFLAHRGMLDVHLSSLVLTLLEDFRCIVEVADHEEPGKQVQIARGSWRDTEKGIEVRPTLTFFGCRLFGEVYSPGSELDPMLIEGMGH